MSTCKNIKSVLSINTFQVNQSNPAFSLLLNSDEGEQMDPLFMGVYMKMFQN